jgi:hypothetical protein
VSAPGPGAQPREWKRAPDGSYVLSWRWYSVPRGWSGTLCAARRLDSYSPRMQATKLLEAALRIRRESAVTLLEAAVPSTRRQRRTEKARLRRLRARLVARADGQGLGQPRYFEAPTGRWVPGTRSAGSLVRRRARHRAFR